MNVEREKMFVIVEQMACRDAEIGFQKNVFWGTSFLFKRAPWTNLYMNPKRKEVFMRVKKTKTEGQVEQN